MTALPSEARPTFFVIEQGMLGESAALYYDEMPRRTTPVRPALYALRLDILPNADFWLSKSLVQLHAIYLNLKEAGKLPVSNLTK